MKPRRHNRHVRNKRHRHRRPIRVLARVWALAAIGGCTAWGIAQAAEPVAQAAQAPAGKAMSDRAPASDGVSGDRREERVAPQAAKARRLSPEADPALDRSGRTRVGKASFYAKMFAGRPMADGTPMEPTGDNAASRTLPLGTTAKVTNLATGKTAIVTIRDRGPFVAGRIVDLSPATARQIGLTKRKGVTKVEVAPIAVPLANGDIKLGDGVLEASNLSNGHARLGPDGWIEERAALP